MLALTYRGLTNLESGIFNPILSQTLSGADNPFDGLERASHRNRRAGCPAAPGRSPQGSQALEGATGSGLNGPGIPRITIRPRIHCGRLAREAGPPPPGIHFGSSPGVAGCALAAACALLASACAFLAAPGPIFPVTSVIEGSMTTSGFKLGGAPSSTPLPPQPDNPSERTAEAKPIPENKLRFIGGSPLRIGDDDP